MLKWKLSYIHWHLKLFISYTNSKFKNIHKQILNFNLISYVATHIFHHFRLWITINFVGIKIESLQAYS